MFCFLELNGTLRTVCLLMSVQKRNMDCSFCPLSFMVSACALQFIMDYVATEATPIESRDQIFIMRVTKQNYWLLAESLIHYMNVGFTNQIARHRSFRDQEFTKFVFSHLEKRDNQDDVILREDTEVTVRLIILVTYPLFEKLIFSFFAQNSRHKNASCRVCFVLSHSDVSYNIQLIALSTPTQAVC